MKNTRAVQPHPPSPDQDPDKIFCAGLSLLRNDDLKGAMVAFENALRLDPEEAMYMSYLGLTRVLLRKGVKEAVALCEKAADKNFWQPEIYHNLGRVYLMRGERKKALDALMQGLKIDKNDEEIPQELNRMRTRSAPPIPFLHRDNPLNFYLGKLLGKLGLR